VKVRGYVQITFEHSLLIDERCPEKQIWFAFADGSVPQQILAYVNGRGTAGGKDSRGRPTPPLPVRLVRDENLTELTHYWELSAKGAACADGPPPEFPPDCTTYRVTARFTGRVDGVSRELHTAHMRRSDFDQPDGKGFGHMGLFDAEIVVCSVENVVAVDELELRKTATKAQ
jgi:hypothetical protein